MTLSEILQIVIGSLTLLVTAIVPIMIYWLQKKHEKEMEEIRNKQTEKELSNKANEFLIDHENERDYLPWCIIASTLHRQERHTRKIYTDFCRCDDELQREILKQAGFTLEIIKGGKWVDNAFDGVRGYIKANELGRDWLYDGAKYFHRSFERYREEKWEHTPRVFAPILKENTFRSAFGIDKIDIGSYIEDYLWQRSHSKNAEETDNLIAPIDYVERTQNLSECEEIELCRWIMDIIFYVSIIAHNTNPEKKYDGMFENNTDAFAETFEDRYYETLLSIYYAFGNSSEKSEEKAKKQKKKHNKKKRR